MPPIGLREVSRVSRALIAERYADRVEMVGLARADSESEYAEILLTVKPMAGDRRGPRTLLVQVHRKDAATLERDLKRRLARALRPRPSSA